MSKNPNVALTNALKKQFDELSDTLENHSKAMDDHRAIRDKAVAAADQEYIAKRGKLEISRDYKKNEARNTFDATSTTFNASIADTKAQLKPIAALLVQYGVEVEIPESVAKPAKPSLRDPIFDIVASRNATSMESITKEVYELGLIAEGEENRVKACLGSMLGAGSLVKRGNLYSTYINGNASGDKVKFHTKKNVKAEAVAINLPIVLENGRTYTTEAIIRELIDNAIIGDNKEDRRMVVGVIMGHANKNTPNRILDRKGTNTQDQTVYTLMN